jgi:hypothetical protein
MHHAIKNLRYSIRLKLGLYQKAKKFHDVKIQKKKKLLPMPNENVEARCKHSKLGLARTVKNSRTQLQSALGADVTALGGIKTNNTGAQFWKVHTKT